MVKYIKGDVLNCEATLVAHLGWIDVKVENVEK